MSSFELLELFGVTIIEPEGQLRSVRIHGDIPGRLRTIRIYPDDAATFVRVEFAPEDGALAEALRGGGRPEWKDAVCQSANELSVLRVIQAPEAKADEYGARLFLPVDRQRELAAEDEHLRAEQLRLRREGSDDGMAAMWTQKEVS